MPPLTILVLPLPLPADVQSGNLREAKASVRAPKPKAVRNGHSYLLALRLQGNVITVKPLRGVFQV